jgi:hypothetical protein
LQFQKPQLAPGRKPLAATKTNDKLKLNMKTNTIILLVGFISITIFGCNKPNHGTENNQKNHKLLTRTWLPSDPKDTVESAEEKRFYELTKNLQPKYEAGKITEVKSDVGEIKQLLPNFKTNWNYGNAIHKMNIVEGRIALQNGNIDEAKKYLILAGQTNGSPQLNSFGPNMSLAKELLEKKESKVVLQYFDLCSRFWESDFSKLDEWKEIVQQGEIPNFGANLEF